MSINPKVSIIIPVFNGSNYLSEAIDSALAQSYENIEVLVVNDGSNDGGATDAIAQKYRDSIRYFTKSNGGVATALNRAIDEMSGDYFSWLSHDDIYEPSKVATQIDYLRSQEFPDDIVVYSDYSMLNENTGGVKRVYLQNCGPTGFRCRLLLNSDIHGCTLLIPRAAFDTCGKFKPEARATQDYEMWFRLGAHYKFHHVPQSLVIGRIHGEQLGVRIPWRVQENILLRSQWLSQINSDEVCDFLGESVQMSYAKIANSFAKKGFYRLALKAFLKALKSSSGKKLLNVPLIAIRLSISFVYGLTKKLYSRLKHRK